MPEKRATDLVDDRELQVSLANRLHGWKQSGKALERAFEFADFKTAMRFVNAVAEKAEDIQHHPDIDIRYNLVKMVLSSHDAGGITRRDLTLAGYIDERASNYENKRKTA